MARSAYGTTTDLVTRNTKDVYLRAYYKFNLERDPESRHGIQAAGPTGPRDHTSIRVGAFYYHGTNQQNFGSTTYAFTGTINEPFYRAGGDLRFKYRKLELFAVGLVDMTTTTRWIPKRGLSRAPQRSPSPAASLAATTGSIPG